MVLKLKNNFGETLEIKRVDGGKFEENQEKFALPKVFKVAILFCYYVKFQELIVFQFGFR